MYNNKLAVALKSAGQVLRESGEIVRLPFGSEYSVLIKNLNGVRALVKIEIDGVDVGDGTKFVVNANSNVELERFIKNGNLNKGNRFKFIERTANIEKNRGVGVEDGLVRIEFNFEQQPINVYPTYWNNPWTNDQFTFTSGSDARRGIIGNNANYSANTGGISNNISGSVNVNHVCADANLNDAGITVPGSVSDQTFKDADWFPTETETHVIVLQMLGQTEDNQQVTKPVTVKAKPKCTTCGRTNKAVAKFCTECGTSLTIV